ncbi:MULTISPECIES: hypothetical protein [Nocardia]|uniref:hypothetical protein n=1 Tax=Nocardia TaxID=1817 RepID=UPI000FD711D3|nr:MULTISPECIES: hypothetical protein [Nocardia]MBF6141216.1 hypothetical protein [Nocardia farcinica]MBF6186937.1 hypothetical protein [Nocardia farcinica]MBF6311975.1 hypothetical protein [Nocardia farcinica]MBF6406849.1 hypothetical protein [Nocardia farcinica]UEX22545.1 hypothetical protein LMJ57_27015 [Nocardia farcinica]
MDLNQARPAVDLLHTEHGQAANESIAEPSQERPKLPTRQARNPSMAATIRLWHTRDRDLLERVAAGLRHLNCPVACDCTDPVRGRAHAIHLMADHAGHDCPRFRLAAQYIEDRQ